MQDPLKNTEEKKNEDVTNKERLYYVLAFIPFVNIAILFTEMERSDLLNKFINQWITILVLYFCSNIILGVLWLGFLIKFLWLIYMFGSLILAGKAYNGNYVSIPIIEEIASMFKEQTKTKK